MSINATMPPGKTQADRHRAAIEAAAKADELYRPLCDPMPFCFAGLDCTVVVRRDGMLRVEGGRQYVDWILAAVDAWPRLAEAAEYRLARMIADKLGAEFASPSGDVPGSV